MFNDLRHLLSKVPFARMHHSRILSSIQVLIAVMLLAATGAMSFTVVRYARSNAANDLVDRGATVTSIVSRAAGRALESASNWSRADAEAALDEVIYNIRAEEGLEFAFVVDSNKRIVVHSDNTKKGKILRAALSAGKEAETKGSLSDDAFYYAAYPARHSEHSTLNGATIYEFVRPIRLRSKAKKMYPGSLELHLGFSLPGSWSFARTSLKRIVPGLVVAFLLLIVGNYLARLLVGPLNNLKKETAATAKAGAAGGDSDNWQLELEASGEIADIAKNWNDMVENFRNSYHYMVEAKRELEVRNRVMLYEKKKTEAIIDSLSDGVVVIDAYGKISFFNRECENLLGISREAAVGRTPQDVIQDQNILEFMTTAPGSANEATEAGGAMVPPGSVQGRKNQRRAADVELQRKNGSRHIRITRVPVLDANGKPGGAITTFRDATQEKLEEHARKEFVSNVTHELRAPLTAIKSYVEMLIDDEAKDPELQRDFFNTINEEADRLARLIDDMLNMSKIEVGNLVLNKSFVRTRKLIEDAVNGVRSAAKNKSIDLSADIPDDLPDIEADKEMVRVAVTNILGNGVKYTQEGGKVFLTAELLEDASSQHASGTIAVTIADNGPGIAEGELDKIFEKFYRGTSTVEQKVTGNGLGLALAREIATLHGGDIKVSSTLGEGSKFTFLLPAAQTSRKVS